MILTLVTVYLTGLLKSRHFQEKSSCFLPEHISYASIRRLTVLLCSIIPIRSRTGKMIAARIPLWRSFPNLLEMSPAKVGPPLHPRSPASASRANIVVPPPRIAAEALLKLPGQRIPTEKPHAAQPASPRKGTGISEIQR